MIMRLALLTTCLGIGGLIGWYGRQATGNDAWYLAVPLLLTAAWLWVSDPTRCRAVAGPWQATEFDLNRDFRRESDPGPPTEPMAPRY